MLRSNFRHAEGYHNVRVREGFKKVRVAPANMTSENFQELHAFVSTQDLQDAMITEKGKEQSLSKQDLINQLPIHPVVICSPLRRTI